MLLAQERGQIHLEEPLSLWFPHVPAADRITLRQLLCHKAGIPDYSGLPSYHEAVRNSPSHPWSFQRFAAETVDKGLLFEPGYGWAYSNPGYMLLKGILEKIESRAFAEIVDHRIVQPLELKRTFVPITLEALSHLAPAPSRAVSPGTEPADTRSHYHPGWVSHGVVASIPSEIARFYIALFKGDLLSDRSRTEMTRVLPVPDAPPGWTQPAYGLGVMADLGSPWGQIYGHNGEGPGYQASAFYSENIAGTPMAICAMCASEADSVAKDIVFSAFDLVSK
jgi:D-alanyl-D-alanine carboxypeptidase